ncbi:MAG: hypothetical protein PHT62_08465 [Desulfotomaculaceae bacterium]|nr:hypothetical protein [Desulfotomaculaceae bacterium]
MFKTREIDNKTENISGLALALLFDRCFIDLFDLYENNDKPFRIFKPQQSLLANKQVTRVAGKEVFLRRF